MFAALTGMAAAGVGFFVGGILHNEFWKLFNKEQHRQLTQVTQQHGLIITISTLILYRHMEFVLSPIPR